MFPQEVWLPVTSNEDEGWESYLSVPAVRTFVIFLWLSMVNHHKNFTKLSFCTRYRHVRGHTVNLACPSGNSSLPRKLATATKIFLILRNLVLQDSLLACVWSLWKNGEPVLLFIHRNKTLLQGRLETLHKTFCDENVDITPDKYSDLTDQSWVTVGIWHVLLEKESFSGKGQRENILVLVPFWNAVYFQTTRHMFLRKVFTSLKDK